MLKSIKELSAIAGTNRETVEKRAAQLGLIPQDGPRNAKLYDTRAILQLVPIPSRYGETEGGRETRDQAAARKDSALADKTELEVARLRGDLAPVSELMEAQNAIFEQVAAIVKKSALTDADKEDILSAIAGSARIWEGMG
jgi:hypothetical protein